MSARRVEGCDDGRSIWRLIGWFNGREQGSGVMQCPTFIRRTMGRALLVATLLVMAALGSPSPTLAQSQSQSQSQSPAAGDAATAPKLAPKSFMPPRPSDAVKATELPSGPLAGFYAWVTQQQRTLLGTLATSLRDIKNGNPLMASLMLIGFSFAYGVLHAAGPGHGKAIVSSYMLTDGQTARRGVQLAFLSAAIQAVSAILLFGAVVFVLRGTRREVVDTEILLERASWLIVAGFGAYLLIRQTRALLSGAAGHAHAHHVHGDHAHGHDHGAHNHAHDHHAHGHAHHDHGHSHDHGHHHHDHKLAAGETCDTCGHTHLPEASQLAGAWSWRRALTLAFGVGIRPCTGAIGVLFVASGLGLMWAGIASTIVMSIGTAITVSTLAILAVSSRDLAARLAGASDNGYAAKAQSIIGFAGALLVFALGSAFFYYALTSPQIF